MKSLRIGLLLALLSGAPALLPAQTVSGGASGYSAEPPAEPSATPAPEKKDADKAPAGPTVIDSENMDYDGKTRVAVFTGDYYGVFVKDPSFTVYCDKLTAYMRRGGGAPPVKGAPSAKPTPAPTPRGKAGDASSPASTPASRGGGLQRAVAEGPVDRPVVIVQDKPAANGQEAQHDVGIALKADYNADTGDIFLSGWPKVSQGINTQIATSPKTIMIMNKDGRTMRTIGPSRSIIQEQQQQPRKNDDDSSSSSPSQTPAASPQ
jgi:hypothetical protein